MHEDPTLLLEALANSTVFVEFRQAFTTTTGLPLALRPSEAWQPPLRGAAGESRFCAKICSGGRFCSACQHSQHLLSRRGKAGAVTITCWCGMAATVVPVSPRGEVIGFLQTGQVFRVTPDPKELAVVVHRLREMGQPTDGQTLRQAYLRTRVMPTARYRACVELLEVFARHLALVGEQIVAQEGIPEPSAIRRAREFIHEHHDEPLRMPQVARAVNSSPFHFCKNFHRVTGQHFSQFLSDIRIEKAKNLLLNPDVKVSEIAYTVGFQSLTHFNRVFKKTTGLSPSGYRSQALAWRPAADQAGAQIT
jgi:AraC-like DNA-binding protein/ligand-binding sensor protein